MSRRKQPRIVEEQPLMLLPPAKDKCQECAVRHDPELPHDRTSLFYQVKFQMDNGRYPTWDDAMAHCTPDVREAWRAAMARAHPEELDR